MNADGDVVTCEENEALTKIVGLTVGEQQATARNSN
jgi:hypothetical protein